MVKCIKAYLSFRNFARHYQLKRMLIMMLLIGVFQVPVFAVSRKNTRPKEKPNIIFILTDDHRWDALGAMGNKIIQTPHLDKLAKAGILFKNAYVTTSICCVSRASLLCGQYESRHKINNFVTDFTKEAVEQTYPVLLKNAGYHIGFINKFGVGRKNQPKDYFDYWTCTTKGQPDYKMTDAKGNFIHNTDKCDQDIQEFLDKFGKNGPFCLSVSFKAPHEQDGHPPRFIVQSRYKDLYKDITIPQPQTADPKYWNSFPDFFSSDKNIGRERWKPLFSTPELYQQTVKNYYRLITGVDDVVGNMVKKLKKMGLDKNTVIIFMGDNGMFLGEHGMEGKWYAYEESIRVPLFIYYPHLSAKLKHKTAEQMALNIDIAPTILSMAGVKVPSSMQGENLLDMVMGKIPERQYFFYEHSYLKSPKIPQSEGIVTQDFKYINYVEHGYEELYSIKKDPHETTNLANNPAYKTVLENLRKQYAEQKKAVQ